MHPEIKTVVRDRFRIAAIAERFSQLNATDAFHGWRGRPHAICYYGSNPYAALVRIKGLADAAATFGIPFHSVYHGDEDILKAIAQQCDHLLVIVSNVERLPMIAPLLRHEGSRIVVFGGYYDDAPRQELLLDDQRKDCIHRYANRISAVLSEFSLEGNRRYAAGYLRDANIPVMSFPWGVNIVAHRPADVPCERKALYIGTFYEKATRITEWFGPIINQSEATLIGPDWTNAPFGVGANHLLAPHEFDRLAPTLYSSHSVALNIHHPFEASTGYTCNERTFNAIACGGFLVSDAVARVREFFSDSEVVMAATPAEYAERAAWFMQHPDERYPYMLSALRTVYTHHTYHHRLIDLLGLVLTGSAFSPYCPVLTAP